ncbi:MAG: branched-chain amino acid ABC transporter permease, partial [Candidatus Heimdallarchaeota archaeon]|nr:branched-chain amino acid ABC transporter permease [Candidatus Heimdallarchaeota archaeon]
MIAQENPLISFVKKINWSYQWQKIKNNGFYIIGFVLLVSFVFFEFKEFSLVGPIFADMQIIGIIKPDASFTRILIKCLILAVFVVSWDLLSGYTGQISFGHVVFFAFGAYFAVLAKNPFELHEGILNISHPGYPTESINLGFIGDVNLGFVKAIFLAAFLTATFAIFLGILTLRSKGPYFALITLVIPLIFQSLVTTEGLEDYTGGENGLFISANNTLAETPESQLKIIFVIAIASIGVMYVIAKSRFGIVLQAIREDDHAASASGVNVSFYKIAILAVSAFFASIAGALVVHITGVSSGIFVTERSFEPIIFTIVGGIGTITGAVLGTFFLVPVLDWYIQDAFLESPTVNTLALAVLLLFVLRFQPLGLVRAKKRLRNAIIFGFAWMLSLMFYDATDDGFVIDQSSNGPKLVPTQLDSVIGWLFK